MHKLADRLDNLNDWIGRGIAWLTVLMVINTVIILIGRDLFNFGRIWMQELTTWMHASVFLLGAAYTLRANEHVRVDIFYSRFSTRGKAWVNLLGTLLLLLPVCGFILYESWDYVFGARGSWQSMETSRQAGGLGFPAPSLLKTFMLLMPVLLSLQGIAIALRAIVDIRAGKPD
ncbi:MAG: TRAP transporter small permease subunit [Pseudomonadota bacterium]